jgi:DNA-binding MarR family transcriptional regulator
MEKQRGFVMNQPTIALPPTGVLPGGGRVLPVLSPRQLEALRFIHAYAEKNRDYPTGVEVADVMGVSKQAVASLMNSLIKKGYAYRDRTFAERNIRLTEAAMERLQLDLGTSRDLFQG